jgi:curved DNA-binding protein CbpA
MDLNEALEIIGVGPNASPTEIRDAYRDLAKVWHPDRFPNDPRLRQKAEEKLRLINDAHQFLQSSGARRTAAPSSGYPAQSEVPPKPPRQTTTEPQTAASPASTSVRSEAKTRLSGWHYLLVGIAAISLITFLTSQRNPSESGDTSSKIPVTPKSLPNTSPGSTNPPLGPKAQKSPPDLSALTEAERQSIEAVCTTTKHYPGSAAYNKCLADQLALLASGPRHPDLSALSEAQRQSIEAACSIAKNYQGPAAYNKCLAYHLDQLKTPHQ